jgi:hypothetical protein
MRVEVLQRHIDAARETNRTAGRGAECPVRLALAELLPGHTVSKPLNGKVWIDGRPVAVPAGAFQWCLEFDADEPVQPFGFEFDPAALVPGAVSPEVDAFDTAETVIAFADPESDKPLVEWMPNRDRFSPVKGFANIYDGRGKPILYRVREVECGSGAGRSFDLVKLRSDAGDRDARNYTCTTTAGGLPWACECRGHLRHEKACKHMRGIGRLVSGGVL